MEGQDRLRTTGVFETQGEKHAHVTISRSFSSEACITTTQLAFSTNSLQSTVAIQRQGTFLKVGLEADLEVQGQWLEV